MFSAITGLVEGTTDEVSIILNTRDIKHCQQVAHLIGSVTAMCHGIHAAESIMRKAVPTKRQIQADKNYAAQAAKGRIAERPRSTWPSAK